MSDNAIVTPVKTGEQPEIPRYKIIKVVRDIDDEGFKQKLVHVKLGHTHRAREVGTQNFFDVDYALVGISSVSKTDDQGSFSYEETSIVASEESGEPHPVYLYLVTRSLTIELALFAIGEIGEN